MKDAATIYMENTYAGNLLIKSKAKGIEIGIEIGEAKVIKTVLESLSVEEVARLLKRPVGEIEKISNTDIIIVEKM